MIFVSYVFLFLFGLTQASELDAENSYVNSFRASEDFVVRTHLKTGLTEIATDPKSMNFRVLDADQVQKVDELDLDAGQSSWFFYRPTVNVQWGYFYVQGSWYGNTCRLRGDYCYYHFTPTCRCRGDWYRCRDRYRARRPHYRKHRGHHRHYHRHHHRHEHRHHHRHDRKRRKKWHDNHYDRDKWDDWEDEKEDYSSEQFHR